MNCVGADNVCLTREADPPSIMTHFTFTHVNRWEAFAVGSSVKS